VLDNIKKQKNKKNKKIKTKKKLKSMFIKDFFFFTFDPDDVDLGLEEVRSSSSIF